jgi:hypothetical protein
MFVGLCIYLVVSSLSGFLIGRLLAHLANCDMSTGWPDPCGIMGTAVNFIVGFVIGFILSPLVVAGVLALYILEIPYFITKFKSYVQRSRTVD